MAQISAVLLKAQDKVLYYVQYDDSFVYTKYQNVQASSYFTIQYLDDMVASKRVDDLQLFVFASLQSNEVIVQTALQTLEDALWQTLGDNRMDEEAVMRNYMLVATTLSEIVDGGYLLTDTVPEVFARPPQESAVKSLLGGVKFLAKTILQ